jgi:signal transduction histidine kinase/ActR/RegA family two-component response regulator
MKLAARTVRQKVLAVVLVTTLVALVVALGLTMSYHLQTRRDAMVTDITMQAELLGHMTAPALAFDDQKLARQNLGLLRFRPIVHAAALYSYSGALFAGYTAPGQKGPPPRASGRDEVSLEGRTLTVYRRIVVDDDFVGTVFMRAEYDVLGAVVSYLGIASVSLAAALLAAYVLLIRLHRIVTGPIQQVGATAREVVMQGDYSRRVAKRSDDEVGELVDSFNEMLTEIEKRTGELEASNHAYEREVAERRRAQQEAMLLNEQLEQRVRERTGQLETLNEELKLATAQAEKANQAKSAFLSGMSHELRTPLNAILGFAQLLGNDSMPSTPEQRRDFVEYIMKAGRHLLVLINEILDLSKIESGAMSMSIEPVALAGLMHECREMMEPLAAGRGIAMQFDDPGELHVLADRTRLKQILLNLLSNAIKYNRPDGSVFVSAARQDGKVRLAVRDTGQGLDESQLAQLFQPFNRLGQEAGAEVGTGIGLVVTRRLAELMDAQVGVSSTVGVGSEFWIDLKPSSAPVASGAPDAGASALAPGAGGKERRTILYVEDNPANLKLVQEIIRLRPDLELMTAGDAVSGIDLARAHQPDMILMDINLPGMRGDEALLRLRMDEATAHIPVVALTANAMPRDVSRGLELGFFRYLTKPIDVGRFLQAVDGALGIAPETAREQ